MPPSSRRMGLPTLPQSPATIRPTVTEPVKLILPVSTRWPFVHLHPDIRVADGLLHTRSDVLGVKLDEVEDTVGETSLLEKLGDGKTVSRQTVARLAQHRVSARNGVHERTQGERSSEVEWGN